MSECECMQRCVFQQLQLCQTADVVLRHTQVLNCRDLWQLSERLQVIPVQVQAFTSTEDKMINSI